ncbi:NADH-quinone oxidoreductase subunit A [Symmachiella dynata]|uniref:NADH-quinone oxidoreductase subunit A n=1 Tax=Symmachiella dynata TaxID=2527995 RepID=A0A517ZH77_9PLAN|nr:NADH-quinone oxidoreductase subunit A [Symmachiella dynata]QDT46330.1 NAD(P)H-quinone oxidoreductase subunit 3 [Symmachiella dynata]QDU41836.1 NAD(P)H-quinone oxidoreductase subunit 3 [Symmachiella dynata]
MTDLVGHFLMFSLVGVIFLLAPLLIGLLVRPNKPTDEKISVYECGEPTIGTSYIQFDLRFYVVALLFIIFDVEVAFFFPWAMIFGGSMQLADAQLDHRAELSAKLLDQPATAATHEISRQTAMDIGLLGVGDILVFFSVLLVGFAYVWKRGDLDWVRAVAQEIQEKAKQDGPPVPAPLPIEQREPAPVA